MAATTTVGSIKTYFRRLKDPRVVGRSRHLLVDIIRRFPQGGNRLKFSLITDGGDRLSVVEFHPIVFQPGNGRAVFIEGRFAENRVVAAAVKGDY